LAEHPFLEVKRYLFNIYIKVKVIIK